MQRRYIYIIVCLLTMVFVVTNHYVDLSIASSQLHSLEATNSLESNQVDDTKIDDAVSYATMKSPLIIKNVQNNTEVINYTYKIKIDEVYGSFQYTCAGKDGYLVFSANGEAEFSMNSNETMTIYELPNEVEFAIEQYNTTELLYKTSVNGMAGTRIVDTISLETYVTFANVYSEDKENYIVPPYSGIIDSNGQENKKNEENPVTGDSLYYVVILVTLFIGILFSLSKMKIKRYE